MEFKICYRCNPNPNPYKRRAKIGAWLPVDCFGELKTTNDGLRTHCKMCRVNPRKPRTISRWKFENNYLVAILNQTTRQIHDNSKMLDMQEIIR